MMNCFQGHDGSSRAGCDQPDCVFASASVVPQRGPVSRLDQVLPALFARSTIRTTSDMMRLSSKSFGV